MAFHQTFEMPASYMNTILALNHHTPVYQDAQALYEQAAAQAVTAPAQPQPQQIRFATVTFTAPDAASMYIPAIWRSSSINPNSRRRQRRVYSWSDTTASMTGHLKDRTDDLSTPPGRFAIPCSSPNCSRRRHKSSEDTAPVHEYSRGHTDDQGLALGRRRTPYPSRNIAGVSWTSTTSCTSSPSITPRNQYSWSEGDDLPYTTGTAAKRVVFASGTTGYKSVLERVPTPYPQPPRSGFKKWCGKMKAKICPSRH